MHHCIPGACNGHSVHRILYSRVLSRLESVTTWFDSYLPQSHLRKPHLQ